MLQTKWIEKKIKYDGSQLRPLYNYLEHKILGNSIVAFKGSCSIPFKNMIDGEDFLQKSEIQGNLMLHFICEYFQQNIFSAVLLQRLFASIVMQVLNEFTEYKYKWARKGDDLFLKGAKLSISIATQSVNSVLFHFAVNITNEGTPVKTCALDDFKVDSKKFALKCMQNLKTELESIELACCKVHVL